MVDFICGQETWMSTSDLQRINDIKIHEVREITKTRHPME